MKTPDYKQLEAEILRGLLQSSERRVFFSGDGSVASPVAFDPDREWRSANSEIHPHREVLAILSGRLRFQLDSRVYEGRPGDVVMIDMFERHDRLYPPHTENCILMWCHCHPDSIRCFISLAPGGSGMLGFEFFNTELVSLFNRTWTSVASGKRDPHVAEQEMNGLVCIIMAAFAEHIISSGDGDARLSEAQNQQYITVMSAISYLGDHLADNPQLGELAKMAGYSTPHFARLFRKYSGYGFRDYIDFMRLRMYETMRQVRKMPKKEIAAELGFSSTSSLIHWLRIVRGKQSGRLAAAIRELEEEGTPRPLADMSGALE